MLKSINYKCDDCGKVGIWTKSWRWYGYLYDEHDLSLILIVCGDKCQKEISNPNRALKAKRESVEYHGRIMRFTEEKKIGRGITLVR